jgi:hypothetical protein
VEDAKRALFLYGNDTSKTVKEVLTDLHKIKGVSDIWKQWPAAEKLEKCSSACRRSGLAGQRGKAVAGHIASSAMAASSLYGTALRSRCLVHVSSSSSSRVWEVGRGGVSSVLFCITGCWMSRC